MCIGLPVVSSKFSRPPIIFSIVFFADFRPIVAGHSFDLETSCRRQIMLWQACHKCCGRLGTIAEGRLRAII
jgi:hypothetical protein